VTQELLTFSLSVAHNPNLAIGVRQLHAIVQVSAVEPEAATAAEVPLAAEVIVIDTSRSMNGPKIEQARQAAKVALDTVRDGSYFAVVAGHTTADLVYPPPPHKAMAEANDLSRAAAKDRIDRVTAGGNTNISTWLSLANALLAGSAASLKHVIMLTDGQSTDHPADKLTVTLGECQGRFACDCRGVGDDWRDDELRQIVHTLGGSWKPVVAPEDLAEDFQVALTASMGKRIPDVVLRVRLFGRTRVTYLAQVWPSVEDLTAKGVPAQDGRWVDFPISHWGPDERDYHLRLDVSQEGLQIENGSRARAARLEVVLPGPGNAAAAASVGASWTDDVLLTTPIDSRVATYTGQEDLAAAVRTGLHAWRSGEPDAEQKMGEAVRLAVHCGNDDLLKRFAAIAELVNPASGVIRLLDYRQVSRADVLWASYYSEQSRRVGPDAGDD
jgi:von Willebrand factor type A domain